MKKRILALILGIGICLNFTGCNYYEVKTSEENIDGQTGRFVILEDEGTYLDEYKIKHHQYLVYDKDTYIIYIYEAVHGMNRGGVSISPFYCMNSDNEPEVAVYWEGMEE